MAVFNIALYVQVLDDISIDRVSFWDIKLWGIYLLPDQCIITYTI